MKVILPSLPPPTCCTPDRLPMHYACVWAFTIVALQQQPAAGTVCWGTTLVFGSNEANAACRALGFETGTASYATCGEYNYTSASSCTSACSSNGACDSMYLYSPVSDYRHRCCTRPAWFRPIVGWMRIWLNNVLCSTGQETSLAQVTGWLITLSVCVCRWGLGRGEDKGRNMGEWAYMVWP
jgi:hypothetical protein